jgi:thymidylate kinase
MIPTKCIVFFGPDGSGKTTHSNLISTLLKKKGRRVSNVRIRANHTISFVLIKAMQKLGLIDQDVFWYGLDKSLAARLLRLWPYIEFVSIVPLVILRVCIPIKLGFTVVCERYVIDTIVSVAYLFGDPNLVGGLPERVLLGFIPKNSLIVYLTANEDLLLMRRKDEPVTKKFINFQLLLYNVYAKKLNAISVDTSRVEKNRVQETIRSRLNLEF